jgi:hypothetical protein
LGRLINEVKMESKKNSYNSEDIKKIGKGAIIAFSGAALYQLSVFISTGILFDWKVWVGGILSVGINAAWKYLQGK